MTTKQSNTTRRSLQSRANTVPVVGEHLTRQFVNIPPQYLHPVFSQLSLSWFAKAAEGRKDKLVIDIILPIWKRTSFVNYFISQKLTEDLSNTSLPTDFNVEALVKNIPAAVLHFPKGLEYSKDKHIASLFFSVFQLEGKKYITFTILTTHCSKEEQNLVLNGKEDHELPGSNFLFPLIPDCSFRETLQYMKETMTTVEDPRFTGEIPAAQVAAKFVLNLLVYLQMLPKDFPESAYRQSDPDYVPAKSNQIFWKPNVIGRIHEESRDASPDQGGTHASPRVHWRRGHWRRTLTSAGHIPHWIRPVLVNGAA